MQLVGLLGPSMLEIVWLHDSMASEKGHSTEVCKQCANETKNRTDPWNPMKHQAISFARTKHGSILLNMSPHRGTCPFERQRLQTHMGDVVPSNRLSAIAISQQVTLAQSFNVPPVRHPWLPQGSPWERWRHTAFVLDQISNDCDYNRLNIYIYDYDYDYINLYHVISNVFKYV